jgi:putative hydrolase of the HAD superfamily
MQGIRAVFLDVGGTLAYPHPSFHTLIAQVCEDHGLPVTAEQVEQAEPAVWARIAERDDQGSGFTMSVDRSQAFWHFVYQTFLREIGYPDAANTELPQRLFETFIRLENYRVYQDTIPALELLHRSGLTLAVISNWEDWLEQLMASLSIQHYFQFAVISGVCGMEKPDAAIFQHALERAGVAPHEALHVGDSLRQDVEGAEAVGMKAVLIDRGDRSIIRPNSATAPSEPEWPLRIRSLLELPGLLGLDPGL